MLPHKVSHNPTRLVPSGDFRSDIQLYLTETPVLILHKPRERDYATQPSAGRSAQPRIWTNLEAQPVLPCHY